MEGEHLQRRVLLCFMNSKRIVTAKSVEEINCAVLEQFNLGKGEFLLQYYDETFEEWIDIPRDYIPSDKEKITVVQTQVSSINREESIA